MKRKRTIIPGRALLKLLCLVLFIVASLAQPCLAQQRDEEFKGWDSLKSEAPEWLKDAKFGIYFHWGVYTVPAYLSEWYSRSMYVPGSEANKHHLSNYGSLNKFGYKEFIPLFKAENFKPDDWVDLFVRAGAKFAGPVAEHADGFSMWDSQVNSWNAKNMGPMRDIVGEMEKAIRKRNLKFITTFHHQWHWGWYPTFDTNSDAGNRSNAGLYGPPVSVAAWQQKISAERPDAAFSAVWLAKVKEVINKYNPDILYFDSRLNHIPQDYRKQVATTFFSNQDSRNKKVILYKSRELPADVGIRIFEKMRMNRLGEKLWLTEEPISTFSWSYTTDMQLRSARDLLNGMIDIVSKNGVFLLNISPMADGTIPKKQKEILLEMGNWLNQFGEAIYGTRPWYTYGEGPRKSADEKNDTPPRNKFFELTFTADDIRYTTKGKTIYAIVLGKPAEAKSILLRSFNPDSIGSKINIANVSTIGSSEKVNWEYRGDGLLIKIPLHLEWDKGIVFRIETR